MQLVAVESAADTAQLIVDIVTDRPPRRLGVATGSSPEPVFRALARAQALPLQTELYLVDEYVGLPPDSPARYRRTIEDQLAGPCGGLRVVSAATATSASTNPARRSPRVLASPC